MSVLTAIISTSISTGTIASDREYSNSGPGPNKRRRIDIDAANGDPRLNIPYTRSFNDNNIGNPISNEPSASNNILYTTTHTSFKNPSPSSEYSLLI